MAGLKVESTYLKRLRGETVEKPHYDITTQSPGEDGEVRCNISRLSGKEDAGDGSSVEVF